MIDENLKKAKITQFINDKLMVAVVYEELLKSFLKARTSEDVHYLAAKGLCPEFLEIAFKDMSRLQDAPKKEEIPLHNIGL